MGGRPHSKADGSALTPSELLVHRLHFGDEGTANSSSVARYGGYLGRDQVAAALARLQARHPSLRAAIVERGRGAEFVVPDVSPPIPLEWRETEDTDAWSPAMLELQRRTFELGEGPLLRFDVLAAPQGGWTDVVVSGHHAVIDGFSHLVLFQELAVLCSGHELEASGLSMRPTPNLPTPRGVVRPVVRTVLRRARLLPRLRRHPFATFEGEDLPLARVGLVRRVWTDSATTALRDRARAEGTSIYGALAAALLTELIELHGFGEKSVLVRSPIEIRTRCEPPIEPGVIGFYAAVIGYPLVAPGREPFWQLARHCRAEVDGTFESGLLGAGWRVLGAMLRTGRTLPLRRNLCNVNNIGVVGHAGTDVLPILEFGGAADQCGPRSCPMLVAATVQGRLNITIHSPWHDKAQLERLTSAILSRLETAVAAAPA